MRSPKGIASCSYADGHRTGYDIRQGQYWVPIGGEWYPVPPEAVIKTENPVGPASTRTSRVAAIPLKSQVTEIATSVCFRAFNLRQSKRPRRESVRVLAADLPVLPRCRVSIAICNSLTEKMWPRPFVKGEKRELGPRPLARPAIASWLALPIWQRNECRRGSCDRLTEQVRESSIKPSWASTAARWRTSAGRLPRRKRPPVMRPMPRCLRGCRAANRLPQR
jgi:hypothetical protein